MTTQRAPIRVAVIAGSRRPNRRSRAVAEWVCAARAPGLELTLVDLEEVGLPPLAEPEPARSGAYALPHTRQWSQLVAGFDAFVLVTPEYNHSTTAALKDALDHLYVEWQDKAVGFVGYGMDGGVRAVEHLRGITSELGMAGVRSTVALRLLDDFLDESGRTSEAQQQALHQVLEGLARWGSALRDLRRAPLEDPDAVVASFVGTLQVGLAEGDADLFDSRFAADVMWGSPYGEVLTGHAQLNAIHRTMLTGPDEAGSRYEVMDVSSPAAGVVLAQVRRTSEGEGFDEMALYVLVHDGERWALRAGQNAMIQSKPSDADGSTDPLMSA